MIKHELHNKLPHWLLILVAVFVSFLFVLVLIGWYFNDAYKDKIAPGVNVAGVLVGGKTLNEAKPLLENLFSKLDNGIPVTFKQKTVNIASQTNLLNPDAAQQLVFLDLDNTLNNAFAIGHSKNDLVNVWQRLEAYFFNKSLDISLTVDREAIINELKTNFSDQEIKPINASVTMLDGQATLVKEKTGLVLNYNKTATDFINQLRIAKIDPITIEASVVEPTVFEKDVQANLSAIEQYLVFPKTKLFYENNSWDLDTKKASQWLGFSRENNQIQVILDQEKIKQFLIDEVLPKVNHDPVQPRLAMNGGRVSAWQTGEEGVAVDLDKTANSIAVWPKNQPAEIEITVTKTPTGANDINAESLGLKEIIGTGTSQFSGSPANRQHNIKVGANALNGLLIKPGEEFSLLKALGKIDGSTGYLQELVIKENKTTPEFGGGLCQIGTTVFRATFNSGLPVTQRRNHSYRVSYYEPAGTDATIYDPSPDYRFVNDTGHYILIQARIGKNSLAFDFWGTKDGRQVQFTQPTIYNIVKPAPTKIVETTDLPEGKKKCTEKAHNGADAYFDYKVTYPNGDIKSKRFSSHYVPWQAVCLVGVKTLTVPTIPSSPTGTITPNILPIITPTANK